MVIGPRGLDSFSQKIPVPGGWNILHFLRGGRRRGARKQALLKNIAELPTVGRRKKGKGEAGEWAITCVRSETGVSSFFIAQEKKDHGSSKDPRNTARLIDQQGAGHRGGSGKVKGEWEKAE